MAEASGVTCGRECGKGAAAGWQQMQEQLDSSCLGWQDSRTEGMCPLAWCACCGRGLYTTSSRRRQPPWPQMVRKLHINTSTPDLLPRHSASACCSVPHSRSQRCSRGKYRCATAAASGRPTRREVDQTSGGDIPSAVGGCERGRAVRGAGKRESEGAKGHARRAAAGARLGGGAMRAPPAACSTRARKKRHAGFGAVYVRRHHA